MSISRQVTIDRDKVMCHCGFYDKSVTPIVLARSHNTREHMGNYSIYDINQGLIDQLTGRPYDRKE